jgi:arabinogalactan endo-1,4-beta-galactosidase
MRILSVSLTAIFIISILGSCSQKQPNLPKPKPVNFAKGADIGWLPQMEASGYRFYDSNGTQKPCLQLLKDRGINTIRLRVWVNPSNDSNNKSMRTSTFFRILIDIVSFCFPVKIIFLNEA